MSRNPYMRSVTALHPCPICGRPDWCSVSIDGRYCACRRKPSRKAEHRVDRAGCDYWLYRLECPSDHLAAVACIPATADCGPPTVCNEVYRYLLSLLRLTPEHRQDLRRRGLTHEQIDDLGYRSLPAQGRVQLAERVISRYGVAVSATVPGICRRGHADQRYWSLAGGVGLVLPVRDLAGQIVALKVRRDDPSSGPRYVYVSSMSYGGPGPGSPVHVPLHTQVGHLVRLTEGELKADIATVLSGMLTLGLPGMSAWRAALPLLAALPAKDVRLAFDEELDPEKREATERMARQAARQLRNDGFTVEAETWPSLWGQGIDDVLAAGRQPTVTRWTGGPIHAEPDSFLPPLPRHMLKERRTHL